jgi:hypothetical protein
VIKKLKDISKRLTDIKDQMSDPYLKDDFEVEIAKIKELILYYEDDGK